jgi:hypothetical protein
MKLFINGAFYTGTLTFTRSIDLTYPGDYVISIYTFFYCPKIQCDADDSLSIRVKEIDVNDYREIFRTGTLYGRIRDNRWKKETILFRSFNSQIFVNSIHLE